MVELALARVELGIGRAGKQSCCCESTAHLGIELNWPRSQLLKNLPTNLGAGST